MIRHIVFLVAGLLAGASNLLAQRSSASSSSGTGFWYAVGLAPGWTRVTCGICAGARAPGMSAHVALGGRTSRTLRVAGELAAWRARDAGVTQTLMSIGAAAYWYPSLRRFPRLYLRGGAALNMHRASDGTDVVTSSGVGPELGVGLEWAISRSWLVGPFFHYSIGAGGEVTFNGAQTGNGTVSFLQLGLSLARR
ncbi:MAG TPA: hypothetical protein VJ755_10135 [Gemmatimonadales bacterium]|nr:hypothetical protein [Gemmatimonadales bacterium]